VLELAGAGCDVAIHYRRGRDAAEELAARVTDMGRKAVTIAGDLRDSASWPTIVRRTVDALGRLDILINNAAVFLTDQADTVDSFDAGLWETVLRVNLVAPVGLCHHARPYLRANGDGRIVNLCDVAAERPWPNHLAYCASKAGLAAMTKGLARALAPEVRVYGVAPGIAEFPEQYSEELRQKLTKRVPLGRAGTPAEVAALVRFLVESGDYITGEVVRIDGGRSLS
jgi:pteridine reductase